MNLRFHLTFYIYLLPILRDSSPIWRIYIDGLLQL